MKYFMDFEFLEGDVPQRICGFNIPRWLSKPNNTIQPISIGLVSSDGREYYAISKDFNLKEAWDRWQQRTGEGDRNNIEPRLYWIRDNVLKPIYKELLKKENNSNVKGNYMFGFNLPVVKYNFTYKNFKKLIDKYGKTNKQIAEEVKDFTSKNIKVTFKEFKDKRPSELVNCKHTPIEFYGYYSAYDHIALCWLFGKMIDLPRGFPMYTIDLKQEVDNYIAKTWKEVEMSTWGHEGITLDKLKSHPNYPKQENTHNALADARWNKELYEFLQSL